MRTRKSKRTSRRQHKRERAARKRKIAVAEQAVKWITSEIVDFAKTPLGQLAGCNGVCMHVPFGCPLTNDCALWARLQRASAVCRMLADETAWALHKTRRRWVNYTWEQIL